MKVLAVARTTEVGQDTEHATPFVRGNPQTRMPEMLSIALENCSFQYCPATDGGQDSQVPTDGGLEVVPFQAGRSAIPGTACIAKLQPHPTGPVRLGSQLLKT